jgi:hypothetical protein
MSGGKWDLMESWTISALLPLLVSEQMRHTHKTHSGGGQLTMLLKLTLKPLLCTGTVTCDGAGRVVLIKAVPLGGSCHVFQSGPPATSP